MMQAAIKQRFTFSAWLTYNNGTDTRYELVNDELIPMDIGQKKYGAIADFLNDFRGDDPIQYPTFKRLNLAAHQVCSTGRRQS